MSEVEPLTENDFNSHYDDPYHRGGCECVTHAAEFVFRPDAIESASDSEPRDFGEKPDTNAAERGICFELAIDEGLQLAEAWWDGQGCKWCEGFASLLCERTENLAESEAFAVTSELLDRASAAIANTGGTAEGVDRQDIVRQRLEATANTFREAWHSPVQDLEDDLADGAQFGGPSLREEC
ncbi:MAG: hypothetical protein AAGG44_10095 [Planctomycetota bacterium]